MIRMESERIPKMFQVGYFMIQDQLENQEQVGRTSSGGKHRRSYFIGGWRRQRRLILRRGCKPADEWIDRWMDGLSVNYAQ
jgi:hypothetical protein